MADWLGENASSRYRRLPPAKQQSVHLAANGSWLLLLPSQAGNSWQPATAIAGRPPPRLTARRRGPTAPHCLCVRACLRGAGGPRRNSAPPGSPSPIRGMAAPSLPERALHWRRGLSIRGRASRAPRQAAPRSDSGAAAGCDGARRRREQSLQLPGTWLLASLMPVAGAGA